MSFYLKNNALLEIRKIAGRCFLLNQNTRVISVTKLVRHLVFTYGMVISVLPYPRLAIFRALGIVSCDHNHESVKHIYAKFKVLKFKQLYKFKIAKFSFLLNSK